MTFYFVPESGVSKFDNPNNFSKYPYTRAKQYRTRDGHCCAYHSYLVLFVQNLTVSLLRSVSLSLSLKYVRNRTFVQHRVRHYHHTQTADMLTLAAGMPARSLTLDREIPQFKASQIVETDYQALRVSCPTQAATDCLVTAASAAKAPRKHH